MNLNARTLLTEVHETITFRNLIIATGAKVSFLTLAKMKGTELNWLFVGVNNPDPELQTRDWEGPEPNENFTRHSLI